MSLQNKFYDAPEPDKVVFEVVFSEKEGGGTVDVTDLEGDLPAGSVVGLATGNIYKPIKGATRVKAIGAEDTTIEIAKGSGFKQGEFIAFGGHGPDARTVDEAHEVVYRAAFELVARQIGRCIDSLRARCLRRFRLIALRAHGDGRAECCGRKHVFRGIRAVDRGDGDGLSAESDEFALFESGACLVNGASVRAVTTNIAPEILASLKSINLV